MAEFWFCLILFEFDYANRIWIGIDCLLQDGPAYVRVFVSILRDIFKEETIEYVLALIDEMLAGTWEIVDHYCSFVLFMYN